jgi:transposase InsO family protein
VKTREPDFKGYFVTGDGKRCDPFTITDAYSRYLIRCQIVSRINLSQVRAICEAAMREYGMPARIRTDNGTPFAGTGLMGLSTLALGWMKLGIVDERMQAGRPQQNGRHERMHRTLKEDTTKASDDARTDDDCVLSWKQSFIPAMRLKLRCNSERRLMRGSKSITGGDWRALLLPQR